MNRTLLGLLATSALLSAPVQAEIALNPLTASDADIISSITSAANQNNITDVTAFLTSLFQADSSRFYSLLNTVATVAPNAMQNTLESVCAVSGSSCTKVTALTAAALASQGTQNVSLTDAQKQAAVDAIQNIEPAAGPEAFNALNLLNLDDNQFSAN